MNRVPVTMEVKARTALGCYDAAEKAAREIVLGTERQAFLQDMFFESIEPDTEEHEYGEAASQPVLWIGKVTFHFDVESKDPIDINNDDIIKHIDTGDGEPERRPWSSKG